MAIPMQVAVDGIIVKVTVTGAEVVLTKFPLIFPLPLAAIPVTVPVLSLVQLKIVDGTFPETTIGVINVLEQIVCEPLVTTAFGVGLTVTVAVILHPFELVYVMVVEPARIPVTNPVLLTVATAVFDDNQGELTFGDAEPLNWVLAPSQTESVPLIVGIG